MIKIIDHGIDHPQYFPGQSIENFDAIATGIGNDYNEALEDALDQLELDIQVEHKESDSVPESDFGELFYYVTVLVKGDDK